MSRIDRGILCFALVMAANSSGTVFLGRKKLSWPPSIRRMDNWAIHPISLSYWASGYHLHWPLFSLAALECPQLQNGSKFDPSFRQHRRRVGLTSVKCCSWKNTLIMLLWLLLQIQAPCPECTVWLWEHHVIWGWEERCPTVHVWESLQSFWEIIA